MFARLSETRMHWIRWILTIAWILIIASLFYDPWTSAFTEPTHSWSPLRLPDTCVHAREVFSGATLLIRQLQPWHSLYKR